MKLVISLLLLLSSVHSFSQTGKLFVYSKALDTLSQLLSNNGSFKKAVMVAEDAYDSTLSAETKIEDFLQFSVQLVKQFSRINKVNYKAPDSNNVSLNYAVYHFLQDTIKVKTEFGTGYISKPYTYSFPNVSHNSDWNDMLVTKLLATHSGNCHSLAYLYKILADELGATCWLALAPNHIYIKNYCKQRGWYNTELTSGSFPTDAGIMASGYLPLEAVQNGLYMDTLSNQQSIALCVADLAKSYQQQTHNYKDGFIIKCCDLCLQYFPNCVQAMLLKAETLKQLYQLQKAAGETVVAKTYDEMEALYVNLYNLGYREMPDKMYQQWLNNIKGKELYKDE